MSPDASPDVKTPVETLATVNLGYSLHEKQYLLDDGNKAALFGELIKMADGIIKHYYSDLYRDAQWLMDEPIEDGEEFIWAPYESGTYLQTGADVITAFRCPLNFKKFYRFTIHKGRHGKWSMERVLYTR